jgi:transcriptional regulator with PAS, ATPase and Fis domain
MPPLRKRAEDIIPLAEKLLHSLQQAIIIRDSISR